MTLFLVPSGVPDGGTLLHGEDFRRVPVGHAVPVRRRARARRPDPGQRTVPATSASCWR
ncbi:MAG: hypothetical protein MZW92_16010 [Comamonadaceae bacterium]|nr:hypothetical protein [Comamonadaceae bacterium]